MAILEFFVKKMAILLFINKSYMLFNKKNITKYNRVYLFLDVYTYNILILHLVINFKVLKLFIF